ncbi:cell wall protein DAN4 [Biomphalaria pfeifferi]|uniref:Cell wall protein DAN4 n=1 Tax=Biomphalaria pfeifferi TaxID=112525 RepID=A0AAD8C477_BIOPF|nr:cell wall protein DAN4 [Biomphalaria pfeifferi]
MLCKVVVIVLSCCIIPTLSQWCSLKYQQCSWMFPCCTGGYDPLMCLQATNYVFYCYPQSEYLAYIAKFTTTPAPTTTTVKPTTTAPPTTAAVTTAAGTTAAVTTAAATTATVTTAAATAAPA